MTVLHLFQDQLSFDPAATKIMGHAFDKACAWLGEFGRSAVIHEILAKRIIEVAKTGERNPDRLCKQALNALADPMPAPAEVAPLFRRPCRLSP
jgi:hypothetical protein